jgi:hypothetical protein
MRRCILPVRNLDISTGGVGRRYVQGALLSFQGPGFPAREPLHDTVLLRALHNRLEQGLAYQGYGRDLLGPIPWSLGQMATDHSARCAPTRNHHMRRGKEVKDEGLSCMDGQSVEGSQTR